MSNSLLSFIKFTEKQATMTPHLRAVFNIVSAGVFMPLQFNRTFIFLQSFWPRFMWHAIELFLSDNVYHAGLRLLLRMSPSTIRASKICRWRPTQEGAAYLATVATRRRLRFSRCGSDTFGHHQVAPRDNEWRLLLRVVACRALRNGCVWVHAGRLFGI